MISEGQTLAGVKGKGIDTVKLTRLLRKNVGKANIVSVAENKEDEANIVRYMVGPHE